MQNLHPLRFQPIFQQYLWGGRRLETDLNKPIGDTGIYAESWEIVDHGDQQSVVANGPLAGKTLQDLVRSDAAGLLGERIARLINRETIPENLRGRFPLLLKFLDAHRDLSVQVHPNDMQGSRLTPPDLGKTEAWLVMDAVPGSKIYAGLKAGVDRAAFAEAVANNRIEETLHSFEPARGDCLFIPAGTVHAIGAGLLITEIQQASNTTFRIFDWNRVDADGQPRPLHIEQAMEVIDFESGPVHPVPTTASSEKPDGATLVECEQFTLQRYDLSSTKQIDTGGTFKIVAVLSGSISISGDPAGTPLRRGDTALIPASMSGFEFSPNEASELLVASM